MRLDEDDPTFLDYERCFRPGVHWIMGPRLGYARIHEYYEECYKLSIGDLILAYNDDVEMMTTGWDEAYRTALAPVKFGVASAAVDEGNGTNYAWAMPMVKRELCERIGRFCAGVETCDRIFDAYARLSGRGATARVKMIHRWHPPAPGGERDKIYNHATSHWGEMTAKWDASAREMMEMTK